MPRIPTYQNTGTYSPQSGAIGVRAPNIDIPAMSQRPLSGGLRQVPLDLASAPVPMVNPQAMTAGLQAEADSFGFLSKAFDSMVAVGQMVGRAIEKQHHTEQTAMLNKATATGTKALNSWMMEYAERQDYQSFDEEYRGRIKELREKASEGLEGTYKDTFFARFDIDAIQSYAKLRNRVRTLAADDASASDALLERQEKEQLILEPSPQARDRIMDRHAARQEQRAKLGFITRAQAVENTKGFAAERAEVEINEMILADPKAAAASIANPGQNSGMGARLALLTPSKRTSLLNQANAAYRQRLADVDRAEAQYDRARNRRQENNFYDAVSQVHQGKLSLPQLENLFAQRGLKKDDYTFLRSKLIDSQEPDPNPMLKQEVFTQILSGEWQGGVNGLARLALPSKDVMALQEKFRQMQTGDDVSNTPAYKMAVGAIKRDLTSSGPGATVLDPDEQRRISDALIEFDQRVRENKEPIDKIRDDVRTRYTPDPPDIGKFPQPRFGARPSEDIADKAQTMAELSQTFQRTKQALKDGRISAQDYRREVANLEGLRHALEEAYKHQKTKAVKR